MMSYRNRTLELNRFLSIILFFFIVAGLTAEESKENFILNSNSELNIYYFWDEINAASTSSNYFLPNYEKGLKSSVVESFFLKDKFFFRNFNYRLKPEINFSLDNFYFRKKLNGLVQVNLTPSLIIQNNFEIDSDGWNDDHYHKNYRAEVSGDWTAYLLHSSLTNYYSNGFFMVGKGNISSSYINNSLFINSSYPPVETIFWHHQNKNLVYDWSVNFLNSTDSTGRFLTFHRYSYNSKKWRIGIIEMALVKFNHFSKEELGYCLPASVLFEQEINGSQNSNLALGLDFEWKFKKYLFRSEIFIDDISIDGKSPNKIGSKFAIGSHEFNTFKYFVEYSRISRWTGNYYYSELRFIENDVFIGHPNGPDSQSLLIKFFSEITDSLFLFLDFNWAELGNSNIDEWPKGVGPSSNFGWNYEEFPNPPTNIQMSSSIAIDYFTSHQFLVKTKFTISSDSSPNFAVGVIYSL